MRNQKKIIEVIEGLEFRQHTSNPKLWFKPVGPNARYGVDMSGIKPVAFKFEGTDHITDESEPVIKETMDAINAALKTKPKEEPAKEEPKEESKKESTEETFECELCGDNRPITERTPVGVPETHDVCTKCTEKITSGKIKVPEWFQKQESIAVDAIPDKRQPMPQVVEDFKAAQKKANEIPQNTQNQISQPAVIDQPVLSNRIHDIKLRPAQIGNIKIGGKGEERTGQRGNKYRLPVKHNHFTITTTGKDKNGDFIPDERIMDILGDHCTEIPVTVLFNDPDLIFKTSYAYFDSAKCQCRGDGRIAQKANGEFIECNPATCKTYIAKGCKPHGMLSVVLRDSPRVSGVHVLRTTSWNTINNIISSLDLLFARTYGQLAGLPMILTLHPKTTLIPGTKKTTTIYMVNIDFDGTTDEMRDTAMSIVQMNANIMDEIKRIESNARLMLNEAPSAEECKDITEEFYPDTVMKELETES